MFCDFSSSAVIASISNLSNVVVSPTKIGHSLLDILVLFHAEMYFFLSVVIAVPNNFVSFVACFTF